MSLPDGTVGMFLHVLSSAIIRWDRQEQARDKKRLGGHYSPHALVLMLEPLTEIREAMQAELGSDSLESLGRLETLIKERYTKTRWRDGVLRQIWAFCEGGKLPTLLR